MDYCSCFGDVLLSIAGKLERGDWKKITKETVAQYRKEFKSFRRMLHRLMSSFNA